MVLKGVTLPHHFPTVTAHVAAGVGAFVGVATVAEVDCLTVDELFTELVDDFTELRAVLVDLKVVTVADTAELWAVVATVSDVPLVFAVAEVL